MRSTSAARNKEKLGGTPGPSNPVDRVRRRSSHAHHTQSQGDLRRISGGDLQDTSSEEDMTWRSPRATSQDRRNAPRASPQEARSQGPGRAKSERDLSRVARVNLNGGGSRGEHASREAAVHTPTRGQQRMKLKTTTIISGDGAVVVKPPETQPQYAVRGTEAVDVTRAPLSRQLAEVRTS